MIVDLHMHEATFSPDSELKLNEMIVAAKRLGLDGIAITDHDSMGIKDYAAALSEKEEFPIFVGVEFFSLEGDIVAFGIDRVPEERIHAQEFVDYVNYAGGVCFSAHPFRNNNRGLAENLRSISGLIGIEAFNASTSFEANIKALEYCRALGLQPLGVSDCHVPRKLGVYATWLPDAVQTVPQLVETLKKGNCHPVGYFNGEYINLLEASALLMPDTAIIPEGIYRF